MHLNSDMTSKKHFKSWTGFFLVFGKKIIPHIYEKNNFDTTFILTDVYETIFFQLLTIKTIIEHAKRFLLLLHVAVSKIKIIITFMFF